MKQYQRTLLIWLIFGLFIVSVWSFFGRTEVRNIDKPFSQVLAALDKGEVKSITISGNEFTGRFTDNTQFKAVGVPSDMVQQKLDGAHKKFQTEYNYKNEETGAFWIILAQWLPMLLILGLFFFFMRQLQGGGGRAMSFGKSKAKMLNENEQKITFKDVAGADECIEELHEIVQFLKDPKKFTKLGGKIPKGVLLMGSPGTGKTLLARAVAGEAQVPFFTIAGSDFVEMFVGVGASRVRDLFEQGKKNAPCIIFIDEIDAVGRQRGAGMGGGHDEREQTLNQLLVEMDGFASNEGVIIIAATNRPDVLDPAIMRPGRFDRQVVVPRPDLLGREAIAAVHLKEVPCADDVDVEVIARATPGMSGADIANLVNEAALIAARHDKEKVGMPEFDQAREKIMMGPERRSMVMSKKELANTAYHEAGHALVSFLIGEGADPVHKVTIIPRGRALGVTMQLPKEDRYSMTKTYALNQIAILMGGRIAEELTFGELTSGAGNDFEKATEIARSMVCEWGMSETMGPLIYGKKEGAIFLGRDMAQSADYSEKTSQAIDVEVKRIISEQYNRAHTMLENNSDKLARVAEALLEYESIDGKELKLLADGQPLTRKKPEIRFKTREDLDLERKKRDSEKSEEKASVIIPVEVPAG